jgi:A/G-specific adenine glycosylase
VARGGLTGSGNSATEVLEWGLPRLRDLPWRQTRDPWHILVSEVMLQQTQTSRVIPKWHAFLEEFPTPSRCAASSLGDVLRMWQGLGYPRRARDLHGAASCIATAGQFPSTLEGLLALPGVGAYTARAVLAFAFEHDVAVVDTNIARVLARVAGTRLTPKQAQAAADAQLPCGHAWAWNQCLMDVGAVLCRPSAPECGACPFRSRCSWRGVGDDPAIGSAGVSRTQQRFDGSDRQARGLLMRAVGNSPVGRDDLSAVMRCDDERAQRLASSLLDEGLLVETDHAMRLP